MAWPDDMVDEGAIERLQTILLQACEGDQSLSYDREYKRLRKELLDRDDLSDVVPRFVRVQRDLRTFWAYIKSVSPQWEPRREHVTDGFRPLFDRIEGRTRKKIDASKWTGRRTKAQQAVIVQNLAPDAMHGIQMLLEEQERPLHNGGPVDFERQAAIDSLRELHAELGELLKLIDADQPLSAQLAKLRSLKNASFKWSSDTYQLVLSGLPLTAASSVVGCGVVLLINAITKGAVDGNLMGAAAAGVHATAAQKGKRSQS